MLILVNFSDLFFQFDLYADRLIREYIRYVDYDYFLSSCRWADQCPTYAVGHDKARLVVGFDYVGQNMAWSGGANSIDKGLSALVQLWYDEVN